MKVVRMQSEAGTNERPKSELLAALFKERGRRQALEACKPDALYVFAWYAINKERSQRKREALLDQLRIALDKTTMSELDEYLEMMTVRAQTLAQNK